MALIRFLKEKKDSVITTSAIRVLNSSGNHVLSSGQSARVLTDERFRQGDNVLLVRDNRGKTHILGGRK